jgi:hypothetical protein
MCELDASRGVPVSLVPRTVRFDPNPGIFGNCMGGCPRGGHPTVSLGLPCKVSINRLSASHRYPRLLNQLAMISRNDKIGE